MSQRITKIKVKQPNGQMSAPIPVGVQAENVKFKASANKGDLQTRLVLLEDTIINKQDTIEGAATSIAHSNLREDKVLVSNTSGKVVASDTNANKLTYLNDVEVNIGAAINQKQNHNIGSTNVNKFLTVDSNGNIIASSNANKASLELIDLTGTKKLEDRLEEKQPKITNNSALVGNDFNLYDEKFPTEKRLKALASGTQGTIVTTNATYNDLQKLAGIAEVTNDSLTTVKAVVDSKVNKTDLKKAITDSKGSTALETFTITLGNTTTGTQSITIPKATTNTAGLMTKTDKANLTNLIAVDNLNSSSKTNALSANMGKLLSDRGFLYRGWICDTGNYKGDQVITSIPNDTYIKTNLNPGVYMVQCDTAANWNKGLPYGYGTLIIFPAQTAGQYRAFMFIGTNGNIYIRHWGAGGNSWHNTSWKRIPTFDKTSQTFALNNHQLVGMIGLGAPSEPSGAQAGSIIYCTIPLNCYGVTNVSAKITGLTITGSGARILSTLSQQSTVNNAIQYQATSDELGIQLEIRRKDRKTTWATTNNPKGSLVWITLTGTVTISY